MSNILTVNGIKYPLIKNKTLLENLEAHHFNVEFHCRDGFCGACRAHLIQGKIKYTNTPIASLRQGEILTCCSKTNNDITLLFNQ